MITLKEVWAYIKKDPLLALMWVVLGALLMVWYQLWEYR